MLFNTLNSKTINTHFPKEVNVIALDKYNIKKVYKNFDELEKQIEAKKIIEELNITLDKPYTVPKIKSIDEKTLSITEERIYGLPLSSDLFNSMNNETKDYICYAIACFCNDMTNIKPILTQDFLFKETMIKKLEPIVPKIHLSEIKKIYTWFIKNSKTYSSIVFSHADFHKDNIFYNPKTKKIIIIDLADSKYENVNDMLLTISSLYSDHIIEIYKSLEKKSFINFKQNENVDKIRHLLLQLQKILNEDFDIEKLKTIIKSCFSKFEKILFEENNIKNIQLNNLIDKRLNK